MNLTNYSGSERWLSSKDWEFPCVCRWQDAKPTHVAPVLIVQAPNLTLSFFLPQMDIYHKP